MNLKKTKDLKSLVIKLKHRINFNFIELRSLDIDVES